MVIALTTTDPNIGKYSEGGFIISTILLAYVSWRLWKSRKII